MDDLIGRMRECCNGTPSKIAWPHRILHEAADALAASDAEISRLKEALEWYAEKVAGCRKLGSSGDPSRHALDNDGGSRARAALEE